ncbi:hypothetical protein F2Q70_00040269 [Brassica cretica]|uniref:Uncharacterized protein n=1 Tax=Brassica cretica TaxID=69181 RepID=A0A8S9K5A2_BRACR|nr:hypothetical protein F2Q70_00040269 [Brassica cretica]
MVTVENIMFMVAMLVETVEVGSYGGGEGGRARCGAVDVDQKLEEVVSSHGIGGGSYRGSAYKWLAVLEAVEGFMVLVLTKAVKEEEPEAGKDQQLYPLVAVEVEKLMAEVEFIAG